MDGIAEGARILFNDRKQPLTVVESGTERLLVDGPNGGEYVIFQAPDDPETLLVAKPGNRQYASRVEGLRTVGRWAEDGDQRWQHTETGAVVAVVENDAGHPTVRVEGIDPPEIPAYGFLSEDDAVAAAREFIRDHPEG
jgi:hypothetical protein